MVTSESAAEAGGGRGNSADSSVNELSNNPYDTLINTVGDDPVRHLHLDELLCIS